MERDADGGILVNKVEVHVCVLLLPFLDNLFHFPLLKGSTGVGAMETVCHLLWVG